MRICSKSLAGLALANPRVCLCGIADPEKARVVMLKFFGGLTNQEVAASLEVTERTVERQWAYAKAWLFRSIRAQA